MEGRKIFTMIAMILGLVASVSAQSYYDDDIYFDSSKKSGKSGNVDYNSPYYTTTTVTSWPGSDTYTVVTTNTRNVDEYNRRYESEEYVVEDSLSSVDPYYYTRRMAAFDNPALYTELGDSLSYALGCSTPSVVNITVNNFNRNYRGYPYYYSDYISPWSYYACDLGYWFYPHYGRYYSLYWNSLFWNPYAYYYPYYWGGYWGPIYAWGNSWGSGPWPGNAYFNPRHPGAGRYHADSGNRGGYYRPNDGKPSTGGSYRPGSSYTGGGRHNGSSGSYRPTGGSSSGYRPGSSGSGYTPSNSSSGSSYRPSSSGSSSGGYRHSSGGSGSGRGSGYSGGSRGGGGYSGGGGHSGGGGRGGRH